MNTNTQKNVSLRPITIFNGGYMSNDTNSQMEEDERLRPLTMEEIDDMLDEAEAAFEAGDYLTHDEVFRRQTEVVSA
jgi:hypothetical protein